MDDAAESRLMEGVPGSYTVPVHGNATDLGGMTFLNMGRFGYLLDDRLMSAGEFRYDRRVYRMRENVMRRMRVAVAAGWQRGGGRAVAGSGGLGVDG